MWYIFNSEKEAEEYNQKVVAVSNFKDGVIWGKPLKHPTFKKWAIKATHRVKLEDRDPQELTEDWTPKVDN